MHPPRRANLKIKTEYDSVDDFYLGSRDRTKSPLFDQISIPFIDASLPPTPKTGRSADALQILLGRRSLDGSSPSLSGTGVLALVIMPDKLLITAK